MCASRARSPHVEGTTLQPGYRKTVRAWSLDQAHAPPPPPARELRAARRARAPPRRSTASAAAARRSPPASPAATRRTDTGNGFYGKYQFTLATWQAVGGSGNPAQASEAEQDRRAAQLLARGRRRPVAGLRPLSDRRRAS